MAKTSILTLFLLSIIPLAVPKGQFVQPLNMGMQMAIPYDIGNIFNNRPISSVIGIVIAAGFCIVLVFSVITSPFGYFFGIPSRKYVLGGAGPEPETVKRSLENQDFFPDFITNSLYLFPEEIEEPCKLLAVCSAHGVFKYFPLSGIKIYKLLSKSLMNMPIEFQEATYTGLYDSDLCEKRYSSNLPTSCTSSGFSLLVKTAIDLLPKWSRKKSSIIKT